MALSVKCLDNCCRLCAFEVKNGVVIFSSEGMDLCLQEKIMRCFRIEVTREDRLPKKLCRPCHARLEAYHKFTERAYRVQQTLGLLVEMKNADTPCNKLHSDSNSEGQLALKNDPDEIEIKDEPLELHGENDTDDNLAEKKINGTDDEHYVPGNVGEETSTTLSTTKESKPTNSIRPVRYARRRKMLQPKKSHPQQILARRKGLYHQTTSLPLSSEESEEEEKEDYEYDEKHEEVEDEEALNALNEEIDDVTVFKGLGSNEEINEGDRTVNEDWKTHWGIKCNQCDKIFPFKTQFDRHYHGSYEKKPVYTCSYCNKTMEKYSTFRSHCYRHVTEGRYRCEYCQKGFSLRSMLHVHILAKHTAVKPFICEECGKGFVTRAGLNIHLKKHKTEEKLEYPCAECGKVLHTRGGLTAHQNVHKLGRRFMCDVCGKTFTQKVNMQQHVKHHTGERPYSCEKCGKCFAEKSHLNRHYSFHSEKRPYQCTICLKMYKTERCLKVHTMVHAEARPYVCTYCSKGFLSKTKLKQHYNIHTGERPYACKYCERTFTNYPNWLKHTRRRHIVDAQREAANNVQVSVQNEEELSQTTVSLQHSQQTEKPPQEDKCDLPHSEALTSQAVNLAPVSLITTYSQDSSAVHQTVAAESRVQSAIPLTQVQIFPEHLMTIPIHHHHILPP